MHSRNRPKNRCCWFASGMFFVVAEKRVFAEQLAARAHQPADRREQPEAFCRTPVDRQPRFPRLRLAARRVQHLRSGGEVIEVVPLVLEQADRRAVFVLQTDPVGVVELHLEHRAELRLTAPVRQLRAIEQHHARRHAVIDEPFRAGSCAGDDRLALHVARQQFPDVAHREDVRIDDDRAAAVSHQFGRHEPQRCERLQVVVQPDALHAVAQVGFAFVLGEERMVVRGDDLHVELVRVARITTQCVLRDDRADDLFRVAVNENAMIHVVTSIHSREPRCCNSRSADPTSCR